jgi:hypothetical protein
VTDIEERTVSDCNTQVIERFRADAGKVGGVFEGRSLLLHHGSARPGTPPVTPPAYLADGERCVIFASKAGAPELEPR